MSLYDPGMSQAQAKSKPGLSPQIAASIAMFNDRAPRYDVDSTWHVEMGLDFVKWVAPAPGASVLDLACGTGLVTIPAARAVGEDGIVVGVDISSHMLEEGRKKKVGDGSAKIEWIEHDIGNLNEVGVVQKVVTERGGFDMISCCSALVLLADPAAAIKHWAGLMKPGGRMIVDVPTEDKTLQYIFTVDLKNAVGTSLPFNREWVDGIQSLEKLYTEAGLEVERSWRTRSYVPERWYERDERDAVFDDKMQTYLSFARDGKVEEAKKAFDPIWDKNLRENGKFWDGAVLYVTVGRRK